MFEFGMIGFFLIVYSAFSLAHLAQTWRYTKSIDALLIDLLLCIAIGGVVAAIMWFFGARW